MDFLKKHYEKIGLAAALIALIVDIQTPVAVGTPEIRPVCQLT